MVEDKRPLGLAGLDIVLIVSQFEDVYEGSNFKIFMIVLEVLNIKNRYPT